MCIRDRQELERIQALAYDDIALDGAPAACPSTPCDDVNDPAYYVNGDWYRWNQRPWGEGCGAGGAPLLHCERLVVLPGSGAVDNARDLITEDGPGGGIRLKVEMQRFITEVDDDCVKEPPNVGGCTGAADYKRSRWPCGSWAWWTAPGRACSTAAQAGRCCSPRSCARPRRASDGAAAAA